MTSSSVQYTDRLSELVTVKSQVLEQLRDLARVQADVTQSCDPTELLSFLARKQPLMDLLAEVQSELAGYAADDPEARVWRTPEARVVCRAQSERCQLLLSEIVLLEKHSLDEMEGRREAIAFQLQNGRDAGAVIAAYHSTDGLQEGSLDLTSAG
ncbi:MAG: hypothetical protein U0892_14655 [Pirellulales bacterium]